MTAREIRAEVLRQLERIDPARPQVDRAAVADRLGDYLQALGLERRRVRWIGDPRSLRKEREWPRPRRGRWHRLSARQARLFDPAASPSLVALRGTVIDRLANLDAAVLSAALVRSRDARAIYRVTQSITLVLEQLTDEYPVTARRADALVPLAAAAAEGLFCFSVGVGGELVCVERPMMRIDEEGRLHDWDGGQAVRWRNGAGYWFWRGVNMSAGVGRHPDMVTARQIFRFANVERRRVAIERMGLEAFMRGVGAEVVQQDDYGCLWRTAFEVDGEPYVAVEVVNSTAEPDGSFRRYFLRVPRHVRTAREAVAWTFGLDAHDYDPVAMT